MFDLSDFLKKEYWLGIEAIMTIIVFFLSGLTFLFQQRKIIYQNKTTELRNEMLAIFTLLPAYIKRSYLTELYFDPPPSLRKGYHMAVNLYLDIWKKIESHKNESLIIEFLCNKNSVDFVYIVERDSKKKDNTIDDKSRNTINTIINAAKNMPK